MQRSSFYLFYICKALLVMIVHFMLSRVNVPHFPAPMQGKKTESEKLDLADRMTDGHVSISMGKAKRSLFCLYVFQLAVCETLKLLPVNHNTSFSSSVYREHCIAAHQPGPSLQHHLAHQLVPPQEKINTASVNSITPATSFRVFLMHHFSHRNNSIS